MMNAPQAVEQTSPLIGLLGSFHPGIVHFPVGLLGAAAILELWQIAKKKPGLSAATPALVILAALTAPPASLFGFLFAEAEGKESSVLDLHKWMGLATTVVALLAAGAVLKARKSPGALLPSRAAIFLGTGLVMITGYLAGEMVYNRDHITKWLVRMLGKKQPLQTTSRFETEIKPIIQAACFKCHGGEKVKGKLKLDTKSNAMKGGENGACIIPGKPGDSSFYTLLIETDPDKRMPEKAKPLPKEQIETIRRWIADGAPWPDGVTIK